MSAASLSPVIRRSLALSAGALALVVPTLSSCGFNYATDQIYNAPAGTDARQGDVDVLSAVIVAAGADKGSFVATFSNNVADETDRVTAIAGGVESPTLAAVGFSPIAITAGGYVNLADDGGITVTGDFSPGDFVQVSIDFAHAESVTFLVPVVNAEGPYEELAPGDDSAEEPTDESSESH